MRNLEKKQIKKLRVAIIADELQMWGGAQDDVIAFTKIFPNSTIFTSIYEKDVLEKHFRGKEVKASFIQKMPFEKNLREEYFLLYPFAFKWLNLRGYDFVLSVSSAFAKFVHPPKGIKHFLYCLTPPRYLWLETRSARHTHKLSYRVYSIFESKLHKVWRKKDRKMARKADMIAGNSKEVGKRIKKFYDLDAKILYPPVFTDYLKFNEDYSSREDWFLYIGRIEKYKGVDLMVKACICSKKKLKIAGKGSYLEKLKKTVKDLKGEKYIEFLGYVDEEQKSKLLFNCKTLIFPVKDEDFGIVPIEANAAGCPVLAFAGGGVLETVVDGITGRFFKKHTVSSLQNELENWSKHSFDPKECKLQAYKFSFEVFENKVLCLINEMLKKNQ